jgi:gluconolactonase
MKWLIALFATVKLSTPEAMVDLATENGVRLMQAEWRYSDTRIVETDFFAPGPDGQPGVKPIKTYDYTPHAGGAAFDDSAWEVIPAPQISGRRSTGRLCFNWYRIHLTVPERVGEFETRGSPLVFETAIDDYAEIWVDGELARASGQSG